MDFPGALKENDYSPKVISLIKGMKHKEAVQLLASIRTLCYHNILITFFQMEIYVILAHLEEEGYL